MGTKFAIKIKIKMLQRFRFIKALSRLAIAAAVAAASPPAGAADNFSFAPASNVTARVVIVTGTNIVSNFQPDANRVQAMVNCGITQFTGQPTVAAAWRSVVSTQDVVGIKVFSAAGPLSGTRPAVVAAVIRGLRDAGLPPQHIIIWDRREDDLRAAGFFKLAAQLGVRAAASVATGFDPKTFYLPDSPVIGNLVWGDLQFGEKGPDVGKKSFVTKLVTREITKIISIAPLLNENDVGVCGHLYSLAMGSVDNTLRFEGHPGRLAVAVPEIYALPSLGDRVALNITDALIGQYEGGDKGLLQYSKVLNQLWFSRDPVALDTLAIRKLDQCRRAAHAPEFTPDLQLYTNAVLLQLGVNDPAKINIEKVQLP
jgi:Domain of unknown function (DUF362)